MSTAAGYSGAATDFEYDWLCVTIGGVRQSVRAITTDEPGYGGAEYSLTYVNEVGLPVAVSAAELAAATQGVCAVQASMGIRRYALGNLDLGPDGAVFDFASLGPSVQSVTIVCREGGESATAIDRVDVSLAGVTRVIAKSESFTWNADGPDSSTLSANGNVFTATALGLGRFFVLYTIKQPA